MEIQDYQQSDYVLRDLYGTARWGVFLSIIGFAFTGIYLAVAIYSIRFIQVPLNFPALIHTYAAEFKGAFFVDSRVGLLYSQFLFLQTFPFHTERFKRRRNWFIAERDNAPPPHD
ncbi:hypothetical protein [Prolixibacter bellariivorans]|uniref:hypothetical protein n=1 Tax=Prolixibacter bellariivorans TaxID=314319 RepID=UPI000561E491|nr:hypothetical protein [Prolixibacter bellariivorans]